MAWRQAQRRYRAFCGANWERFARPIIFYPKSANDSGGELDMLQKSHYINPSHEFRFLLTLADYYYRARFRFERGRRARSDLQLE
jgi:hypothetical protein